jgi:hypothetical protein
MLKYQDGSDGESSQSSQTGKNRERNHGLLFFYAQILKYSS